MLDMKLLAPWLVLLSRTAIVVTSITIPSMDTLHAMLPSAAQPPPFIVDTALDRDTLPRSGRLTLFRERNGWCPYSERVFLAFESKGLDYDTFLIDNMGARPSWFSGTTPQVRWPDGSQQSQSMDAVFKADELFHSSSSSDDGGGSSSDQGQLSLRLRGPLGQESEVKRLVALFQSTFPRNTRPSSRSAFLFSNSGQLLLRSEFEDTLQRTDQLLAATAADGPFFLGRHFTAADIAWAPFLERYNGQLPLLHSGLHVNDGDKYPHLAAWFRAMQSLPCYAARVAGDNNSWRKVLRMQGFGNSGNVPDIVDFTSSSSSGSNGNEVDYNANAVFAEYAKGKVFMAGTPNEEAAALVLRNLPAIAADARKRGVFDDSTAAATSTTTTTTAVAESEEAFRGVVAALCLLSYSSSDRSENSSTISISSDTTGSRSSSSSDSSNSITSEKEQQLGVCLRSLQQHAGVQRAAQFLAARVCVPRDMGALPAKALYQLQLLTDICNIST